MPKYVGAIDQGTTSTRFIVFDRRGAIVALAQNEHAQIYPRPGWVEHDAAEIWRNTQAVIAEALARASLAPPTSPPSGSPTSAKRRCSGTAQPARPCTTPSSGRTRGRTLWSPNSPATAGRTGSRKRTGLPLATYFSGLKLRWLLDHIPARGKKPPKRAICSSARSIPG